MPDRRTALDFRKHLPGGYLTFLWQTLGYETWRMIAHIDQCTDVLRYRRRVLCTSRLQGRRCLRAYGEHGLDEGFRQ
jgi:hypothetical protein